MSAALMLGLMLLLLAPCSRAQEGPAPVDDLQQVTLQAGDITAVLGNHADRGSGRTGYIGLHSLTHTVEAENLFVPQYAGLIINRAQASVTQAAPTEGTIVHFSNGQPRQKMRFRALAPHYLDVEISAPVGANGFGCNSASYMNGPTDRHIYFLDSEGNWQKHFDPEHGSAASVFPLGMPLPVLQTVPDATFKHGTNRFSDSVSQWRYDPAKAFYYGRFKDMVYMQMFPPNSGVIFYMSPTGGGPHPEGRPNSAWDWRGSGFAAGTPPGEWGVLPMRLVYKKFVSDEDCLQEYERWVATLKAAE